MMDNQRNLRIYRVGRMIRAQGADPYRRSNEIIGGVQNLTVERDDPALLRGQYRILLLEKTE